MKKRINILFVIICILLFSNISCYAAPDPEGDPVIEPDPVPDFDITPPTGRMQVAEATKAGSNINASIRIEAEDDVSSGNEIQFYISTSPISNQEIIPDENWENYYTGVTKNVTLPNTGGTVYMLLRDKAGNISMVFSGGNAEYEVSYNTNGGNSMEISGTARAIFGCPFIVTSRVPKKSGSNFLGWSTNRYATVPSYAPDDVIPASVFNGVIHNITLYAIWESTIVLIDENTDYVGYYADVDGNGSVDGIIFADLAQPVSGGQWGNSGGKYSYTKPTFSRRINRQR